MTVLYLQSSLSETNRRALEGARSFATQAGWNLVAIHYGAATKPGDHAGRLDTPRALREVLASRNPAGCIVEEGVFLTRMVSVMAAARIPVVIYDRQTSTRRVDGIPCVKCDNAAVVSSAAKELFSFGFNDYAFVPHHEPLAWNVTREKLFHDAVERNCAQYHVYSENDRNVNAVSPGLVAWLRALPRPCGVFAANDQTALRVLEAAESGGISVPDDLVVVGVDDDLSKCETAPVSLTSVRLDVEAGGRAAAEMLDACIRGRTTRVQDRSFGVAYLARRASSRPLRAPDARVARALESIRQGISGGITAQDVARSVGMPLRTLHRRFLKAVGHAMGEEIREARLEMAKRLLSTTDETVTEVAGRCGYDSDSTLRKSFMRCIGMSPSAWRQSFHR